MDPSYHVVTECPNCNPAYRFPSNWTWNHVTCSRCGAESMLRPETVESDNLGRNVAGAEAENNANPSQPVVPRIAIIGTEGSGKTVLITTLAKRFSQASPNGAFLYPLDNNTMRYVERTWLTLCSGEWPASTLMGQLFELRWRLECGGDSPIQCDLRIVDAAGQNIRQLFSDDEPGNLSNYNTQLRTLDAYCKSSDIVICLVNPGDFLGEGNTERRLDNEVVIKSALQRLTADPARRLCLLFTQIDQYPSIRKQEGEYDRVVKQLLPYVHGAHLAKGQKQVVLRMVASVKNTVKLPATDKKLRRVPSPGFESFGFEGLMEWLVGEVRDIVATREATRQQVEMNRQAAIQQTTKEAELDRRRKEKDLQENAIAAVVAIGAVVLSTVAKSWVPITFFIIGVVAWWWTRPPAPKMLPVQQHGNFLSYRSEVSAWIEYGRFNNDISIRNDANRMLTELTVTVVVRRKGTPIGNHRLQVTDVPAGATRTWRNVISVSRADNLALTIDSYSW